jgi:hypothetical protein
MSHNGNSQSLLCGETVNTNFIVFDWTHNLQYFRPSHHWCGFKYKTVKPLNFLCIVTLNFLCIVTLNFLCIVTLNFLCTVTLNFFSRNFHHRWLHCIWFSEKCTKTKKNAGCLRQPVMELRLHFDWRLVVLSNGSHLYHFIIDFFRAPKSRNCINWWQYIKI